MNNLMKSTLVVLGFVLGTCTASFAMVFGTHRGPEIDPGLTIDALALLAGTLTVLHIRRRK